ncbi:MAG: hypothetical protein QE570_17920 [Verrucomicrobiota bacterium]|nr:hypothetical protein [Verrucomicrobiota bacterium]
MFHWIQLVRDRDLSLARIHRLSEWMNENPEVPPDRWFKKFSSMTVCGGGSLVKTFGLPYQAATGKEVL